MEVDAVLAQVEGSTCPTFQPFFDLVSFKGAKNVFRRLDF